MTDRLSVQIPPHDTSCDEGDEIVYSPEYLAERERMFNLIMQGVKKPQGVKPEISYQFVSLLGPQDTIREKQRYSSDNFEFLLKQMDESEYKKKFRTVVNF